MIPVTFTCKTCNSRVEFEVREMHHFGSAKCRVCDTLMKVEVERDEDDDDE